MAYKDFTNADKTESLMYLTGYSKNDIIYCSSKVIDAAKKVAQAGGGAHMMSMVEAARAIANSSDPLNASYYNFIGRYFALIDPPGFIKMAYANITSEERECMKALFWFESQLMQGIDQQNVSWVNTSVVAPANSSGSSGSSSNGNNSSVNNSSVNNSSGNNSSGNGNGNGEDNPFYKQTWFVALGSIIGLSAIGFIGYSIFKPRQIAQF